MLPIGVLIPTRNSMPFLPGHLQTMRPWLDCVQEIIVVDSESNDGTCELLKKSFPPERTRFLQHPPGLYQSWNFGLQQITSRYAYVSTVGDGITREGLGHLVDVAEELSCDVVVSPPQFVDEAGRPIRANNWPVHDLISILNLREPECMEGLKLFAVALSFLPFAILGSSASNLYRSSVVRKNPFPTEFGMNGDGAWGLINALDIRLGITPRCISFFRQHRKAYVCEPYHPPEGDGRMHEMGLAALERYFQNSPEMRERARDLEFQRVITAKEEVQRWRHELFNFRSSRWPWILRRRAWRARRKRDAAQRRCLTLARQLLLNLGMPVETETLSRVVGITRPAPECPV